MNLSTTSLQAVLLFALSTRTCYAQHGFLTNVFKKNNGKSTSVKTTGCNGSECFIDTSTFDIVKDNEMDSVSFDLHGTGRSITCQKHAVAERAMNGSEHNQWVGKCDGGGFVNLVQRGTNDKGEKLMYGSISDFDTGEICTFSPTAQGINGVTCISADDFGEAEDAREEEEEDEMDGEQEEEEDEILDGETDLPSGNLPLDTNEMDGEQEEEEDEILDGETDLPSGNLPLDTKPDMLVPDTYTALRGSKEETNDGDRRNLQQTFDDSGGNIDIMVVWTSSAECMASGLGTACTFTATTENNIRGKIDAAIAETNMVFANSGINSMLRLVHAYRDDTYTETSRPNDPYDDALNAVTYTDDGQMENVHALREQYGADVVSMVTGLTSTDRRGVCGRGWRSLRKNRMFSVVDQYCLTGNYLMAHEIGHNFGVRHDRPAYGHCSTSGYGYGYRDTQSRFRTVLASNCRNRASVCGNIPQQSCSKIPYFSSSVVRYGDSQLPTGNAQNDAARLINESLATVAAYYPVQQQWEDITYDNFEGGWGNFRKYPGTDDVSLIVDPSSAYITGTAGIRLRDNSGVRSALYQTSFHDVSNYSKLRVQFSYCAQSMEGSEDFFVELRQYGGSWTRIGRYVNNVDFTNGSQNCPINETIEIDASSMSSARIRFRCDASGNGDYIYIDDVSFQGQL